MASLQDVSHSIELTDGGTIVYLPKLDLFVEYKDNESVTFVDTYNNIYSYRYSTLGFISFNFMKGWIDAALSNPATNQDVAATLTGMAIDIGQIRTISENEYTGFGATNSKLDTINNTFLGVIHPLNEQIEYDHNTITTRNYDFNLAVRSNLVENHQYVFKEGMSTSIPSGTVQVGINDTPGLYSGFPITPQTCEIVVAGADTGIITYNYLETSGDTTYKIGTLSVAGAGTYAIGHQIWRSNYATFNNANTFNVGNIQLRSVGATYTFWNILVGIGQTQTSAYTVPSGWTLYFDSFRGSARGNSTSVSLDGTCWHRVLGNSPQLRFNFEFQFGAFYMDDIDYLVSIPQLSDFSPIITYSSANNTIARCTWRGIMKKN